MEIFLIQAVLSFLTKKKPTELAKFKKILLKLRDYIDIVFPEEVEVAPKRLSSARKSFVKDAEKAEKESL